MANKYSSKTLNSKSLAKLIEGYFVSGKTELATAFLQSDEVQPFLSKILVKLKNKQKKEDFENTFKIFSPTEVDDSTIDNVLEKLISKKLVSGKPDKINFQKDALIVAGMKIKYKNLIIDGTLDTIIKKTFTK